MHFEGIMQIGNEVYTIRSFNSYHLTKRSIDAQVGSNSLPDDVSNYSDSIIIYRESDRLPVLRNASMEEQYQAQVSCGMEGLSFNQQQTADISRLLFSDNPLQELSQSKLFKRAESGCPTAKKIVYMVRFI
jgi:hypothetical protein